MHPLVGRGGKHPIAVSASVRNTNWSNAFSSDPVLSVPSSNLAIRWRSHQRGGLHSVADDNAARGNATSNPSTKEIRNKSSRLCNGALAVSQPSRTRQARYRKGSRTGTHAASNRLAGRGSTQLTLSFARRPRRIRSGAASIILRCGLVRTILQDPFYV
jgi:hypothetical protein